MKSLLLVVAALAAPGCATLFAPGPDLLSVDSAPRGAAIYLDDVEVGLTPAQVTIERKMGLRHVRVEAPGMAKQELTLDRSFNWWSALDYIGIPIYIGYVALAIDSEKGNTYKTSTTPIFVTLQSAEPEPAAAPTTTE